MTHAVDLVDGRLPLPLGGGASVPVPPSDVDAVVGGVPFWLGIDQNNPYQRQTAPFKKDQVDQQPEAGEQSLQSWWLRSQLSFHMGAGLRYLDTSARPDDIDRTRFHDSRGVDVWTPGVVKRLNGTSLAQAVAGAGTIWLKTALVGGTEVTVAATTTTVETYNGTSWTTLASTTGIAAFAIDGANYYYATSTGVFKGPLAGGATTQLYAFTGGTGLVLGWSKARLMLANGPNLYQLDCNAAANSVLPTALLVHPVAGWTWTAFCDTPNGVGALGSAGLTSQVFKFEIDTSTGTAKLGAGVLLLTLPPGELGQDMILYLGSQLILATNRGIRVSTFQSYFGTVTLGPLVQLQGDGVRLNVTALSAYDHYLFGGTLVDSKPALVRVDLGMPIDQPGHYPWAYDLLTPVGATLPAGPTVSAVTVHADGTKAFAVPGYGVITENAGPDVNQPAWLETARMRMGSVEDKHWAHGIVRGLADPSDTITVEAQTPNQAYAQVFQATSSGVRFDLKAAKSEWLQLRFTLGGTTSQLASYVVQALPAGLRQRLLAIPLELFDFQVTRSGIGCGYPGWALERLAQLETIEAAGAEITASCPALFPEAVRGVIEQLSFQQIDDPGDRDTGTGGRVVVQLRTTA